MEQCIEKYEEFVVGAIQEYLKDNRIFHMERVIHYIKSIFVKSSININKKGIQKILLSLAEKKIIVEGTKFTKNDVLSYSRRKKIHDYIKENPGTYVTQIAKNVKICNNVVLWHLTVLKKFNFIKKKSIDNHVVYFDINVDSRDTNKLYLTSNEKCKSIINYLKFKKQGITKTQLSRELNIHRNTIGKYIKSLEKFNILSKEKKSNKTLYSLEKTYEIEMFKKIARTKEFVI